MKPSEAIYELMMMRAGTEATLNSGSPVEVGIAEIMRTQADAIQWALDLAMGLNPSSYNIAHQRFISDDDEKST